MSSEVGFSFSSDYGRLRSRELVKRSKERNERDIRYLISDFIAESVIIREKCCTAMYSFVTEWHCDLTDREMTWHCGMKKTRDEETLGNDRSTRGVATELVAQRLSDRMNEASVGFILC